MEKLIEISGLSKAYGKKQALHNVDMVFEGRADHRSARS